MIIAIKVLLVVKIKKKKQKKIADWFYSLLNRAKWRIIWNKTKKNIGNILGEGKKIIV